MKNGYRVIVKTKTNRGVWRTEILLRNFKKVPYGITTPENRGCLKTLKEAIQLASRSSVTHRSFIRIVGPKGGRYTERGTRLRW